MQYVRRMAVVAFALARFAGAQEQAQVTVTGGMGTDPLGVQRTAVSIAPSVTFSHSTSSRLSLGATVIHYGDVAWGLGGDAAGEWRRAISKPFALVLNADVNALRFDAGASSTTYASAQARPTLELGIQNLTLIGGVILGTGLASPGEQQGSLGTTVGATFVSAPSPEGMLRLTGQQDHFRVGSVIVNDASLGLVMVTRAGKFMGRIGQRSASDERGGFGDAGFAVNIGSGLQFGATAGHYSRNRLTGAAGGNFVNAGFVFGTSESPVRS